LEGLSVVVPVYNSEASLRELVHRLGGVLPTLAPAFEVILVDDGSSDQSLNVALDLEGRVPWLDVHALMRNYGQHNALLCGIRRARYGITVTMDDDLQHPPEEIGALLQLLGRGADVAYGKPVDEKHGLFRTLASRWTKYALRTAMNADAAGDVSAFRAFRTELREAFRAYDHSYVCLDVLLTWGTTRFAAAQVRHDERRHGTSNYSYRRLLVHTLNMITGYSTLPLQLATFLGFAFMLFGVAVIVFVVGRYLLHGSVAPGFPFLASLIAIFAGVQLFALGIIGEYLARMYFRSLNRPAYVEATGFRAAVRQPPLGLNRAPP
jgi:undecaprenyl-phosphate 4-deoxy-4-formamido-L-arabinose transferase